MEDRRSDPDALLAHVQAEESANRRGKLKIFFGATAGVGKTYAMLEAANGAQALSAVRENAVDLVFLDLRLGREDGLEILKRLRDESPGLPVIMLTARGELPLRQSALGLKPFSIAMGALVVLDDMRVKFTIVARS